MKSTALTARRRPTNAGRSMVVLFALVVTALSPACFTPQKQTNPKDTADLRQSVQDFHMKLRWGLWEQAADYAVGGFHNEFLGRYEEFGEDYKITNLDVKKVDLKPDSAVVEVKQEWYHEPNMTVQKKRYVETWKMVDGIWRLTDRMTRDEYRSRKKKRDHEASQDPGPTTHDPRPETQAP